jgi:Leucine rich repeat
LLGIEVLNSTQEVIVGGEHVTGRTNEDVNVVQIRNSNTPFIIPQIFAAFPNVYEIDVQNSNLQVLRIPEGIQLEYLTLYRNNISRIENGTFIGQSQLEFIEAMDNRIEVIEEGALEGLENLFGLTLIGNRISVLAPRVFYPLVNVVYIDLERNLIERIEDDTFAENPELITLYLEFNQINAVSTTFTSGFSKNMQSVNLAGNRCINRAFALREPIDLILLNNALNSCFNNFVGEVPEIRRVTLEFQGRLQLFDEFGNVIARFE